MSKKNRAKSKAKRFGEGSAKPIVSAATYGVEMCIRDSRYGVRQVGLR